MTGLRHVNVDCEREKMGFLGNKWEEIVEWAHFVTIALLVMYCHYKLTNTVRRAREEILLGQESYKSYCQYGVASV